MKRVLIITYYWPPSAGSGVQRWLKMSKYLHEFGWQPVIFTPSNPDFHIKDESLLKDIPDKAEIVKIPIWEPYGIYRMLTGTKPEESNFGMTNEGGDLSWSKKLSYWVRGNIFIPDPRITWRSKSISFLKKYLSENPVDAFVTTGPPHSMHLIGLGVKKHFPDLKWVADFRDPWSTFDVHNSFLSETGKRKNEGLEKEVLEKADWLVMTSNNTPGEFPPLDKSKLKIITNGFDSDDFKNFKDTSDNKGKFKIYHTGLLNTIRNPVNLWKALTELCNENKSFEEKLHLEIIGNVEPAIVDFLNNHTTLSNKVNFTKWIKHDELLNRYESANLLLLIVNQSRNAISQLPGKLFEYLALKKPLFALCPEGSSLAEAVKESGVGHAIDFSKKEEMKVALLDLFQKFESNHSSNKSEPNIEKYSRKYLTNRLVKEILEK